MRDLRDADIAIMALLMAVLVLLWMGFSEIFERLRPRVIYVHGRGNDASDDDDASARSAEA